MNSSELVCVRPRFLRFVVVSVLVFFFGIISLEAATNRSAYIPYDYSWIAAPDFKWIALDAPHQQIFLSFPGIDRIDVLSAVDYHTVHSITVPSPASLDISPDGTTLAVGTFSAHILFFDTSSYAKTNDLVFPDSAIGVSAFVYAGNGNGFIRALEGLSTGGGITAYWDHSTNAFSFTSNAMTFSGPYLAAGPITRSSDYSKIVLAGPSSGGVVQIIDGNTGQVLQQLSYDGYIDSLAVNKDSNRYAVCVAPAGYGGFLLILDSSFNEIYQDEVGCFGMTFSPDGNTLYRDVSINSIGYTQALDMTTFSSNNSTNYFSHQGGYSTQWEAADSSGMVYGLNPNIPNAAVFVAVDMAAGSTPSIPPVSDPVKILRVVDNVGSPQGGDSIRILCTGADTAGINSITVTIGGVAATGATVTQANAFPTLPNLRFVTVKTPPGSPGRADVVLTVAGQSDTAARAFQYTRSVKLFPFSTLPNFLLYDSLRQKLYAGHGSQVEVIDPITLQVLTPIVPAGKLPASQFAGLSLSPDGNRLYVADSGANLIHELDLTSSSGGKTFDPTKAVGASTTITPARIFETSTGALVGSDGGGNLFTIDPSSGSGAWLKDNLGNNIVGRPWNSTNKGQHLVLSRDGNGLIWSTVALWNAATGSYLTASGETQWITEASANEDGTNIAAGGSTPGIQSLNPEIVDFGLNSIGFMYQHFDTSTPTGTPSFFLHPSGALLYKAGMSAVGGSVEIDDVHQWQPALTITFPEPFASSYSPFTDHMLTVDDSGRYLFGVTNSGITMMVLDTLPLSIGNIQPSFGPPAGGQTATIRGSGFQSGAVAIIGGSQLSTTFVDENTLTVQVPALSSGWQDVTVKNSNGDSYTAPGLFQVLPVQPSPVITGFSPASLTISLSEFPLPITIVGSGFEGYSTVEINGQPIDSALVDSSHIQATIPYGFTGQTGSVPLTVVSPYTGSSNTMSISLVNPVPIIDSFFPVTLATGASTAQFTVSGKNFVAGTVAQWNGQNLVTLVAGGYGGEEVLVAHVPANLLTSSGTATISLLNPAPGGGLSNTSNMDVSPAHPVVSYPSSISFGTALLNVSAIQTVQLENVGSANYNVSSITVGSGPFSVQPYFCQIVTTTSGFNYCVFQVNFSPTTTGSANTTLTITDNAAGSPHVIPVTGTGTQTLAPIVALSSADALGQTVSATVSGSASVGGPNVPATAWIEYGTDFTLSTFSKSTSWSFTGDAPSLSGGITGLTPSSTYAARLVVQTSGGVGKSGIAKFATMPAWPEVNLQLANGASNVATITAGQSATYQLVVWDGGNGYTGSATLSCSGAPTGSICSVSPATVSISVNGVAVTVTVTTTGKSSASVRRVPHGLLFACALPFAMLLLPSVRRRRLPFLVLLTILGSSCLACGGGSSGSPSPPPPPSPTPTGTYYLTVSAAAGGAKTSYLLTLNVQ